MSETKTKIIKQYQSFKIGICNCGCNKRISIRNSQRIISKFIKGHSNRKRLRQNNPLWKGGRRLTNGYWLIKRKHHKNTNCDDNVFEHRYIMELQLGRYLTRKEEIHHIDGNRSNNNLSNLMLFESSSKHRTYEQTKDMSTRFCLLCNDKTISNKKGNQNWYIYKHGFICSKCYQRQYLKCYPRKKN